MVRQHVRQGIRLAPRLILAAVGMAAASVADGGTPAAIAMHVSTIAYANEIEGSLMRAFNGLRESNLKQALTEIDKALESKPNFLLGHLLKGDMLMARAGRPVAFASLDASAASVAPLQDEARVRVRRYLDAPRIDYLPAAVLQLSNSQQHVLVVDTTRQRLFVYANELGRPRYIADFYISLGKSGTDKEREGDQKTPIGVYRITSVKEKLPDFYGSRAFPIDYPNEWDRMNGRQGHGIWLHGTPSTTYSRPPRATDGCVVLTNDDFARLSRYVDVSRTPVVIGQSVQWHEARAWEGERDQFLSSFNKWKSDWESLDVDRYFSHYSPQSRTDFAAWKSAKRKINSGKSWVKVGVNDMSLFAYPGGRDMMMVTFEQDYRSSNLSNRTVKRQYWVREGREWRILHEAVIS
ncbi:MAG: L,D-transpeptidase family protein [Usitatibacter sp.]